MVQLQDRGALEPRISRISALVLCHAVVLLLLINSDGGQSQTIDQPQSFVAIVGDDIILPCHLEPAKDAVSMTVEWARADLNPRFVHLRREGVELLIEQNPSYIGRTSMSANKLKCGDLSLKLSKVKLSDEGTYTCLTASQGSQETQSVVKLAVGSVPSPVLRLSRVSSESTAVVLDCESKGWYPEPEVSWLDGKGNVLSAGPTKTVRGPDDLYTVSSRVTVKKRHSSSFTCRVQQKKINQTRETEIHVQDDLFLVPSCSVGRIIIVLVVCLSSLAVVLGAFIMQHKSKMLHGGTPEVGEESSTAERQSLMGSEEESSQRKKEERTHVDREKEKLDEELEKHEGELNVVLQVIKALENHKSDLNSQTEKVSLMLNEMIDKPKDKVSESKQDKKERRKGARDEILKNAGKLLKTTDNLIIKMTEVKVRLETERTQVKKQLKEKQKDKIQMITPDTAVGQPSSSSGSSSAVTTATTGQQGPAQPDTEIGSQVPNM